MIVKGTSKLAQLNQKVTKSPDEDENFVIEYSGGMLPPSVSNFDKENM